MRLLSVTVLLAACTDYDLNRKEEDPAPKDTDTGEPVVDTGDTAAEDTGDTADTVIVPDTGDTGEVATEAVYINTDTTLYSFDPSTGVATRIGDFLEGRDPVPGGMTDIAISLDGIMYGGSFEALYRINPSTGECTFVATLNDTMTGLTFVSDGRLVGAGDAVSFVDTRTGRLTTLVPTGEYSTSGDIIGLPDGMLYWTVTGGDQLVQVDPDSGDTRRRGTIGVSAIYGLGYAYGELYGFTSAGEIVTIDPTTGRPGSTDTLAGRWWGATTNPVLW